VTDNETSADITSKVLAQIILDLDAPKFDLFPVGLLSQLIRVNDHFAKGFYEKFFRQALQAFLDYQRLMESQMKQGAVLPAMFPPFNAWGQAMMGPFGAAGAPASSEPAITPPPPAGQAMTAALGDLQRQIAELQKRLKPSRAGKRRASPRKPRR
jgi:polyhydroxyalkanoate synthesis regulator protein